ncbi:MAG: VOC family protein, partial [Gammaproteobacteria bacterium]
VGDADAEAAFLRDALELEFIIGDLLFGPEVERMIGLPPGAGLDFRVFGDPEEPLGRIEIVEYQRTAGEDRYTRARPPARGLLLAGWRCADLAPLRARLAGLGVTVTEHGEIDAIYGHGEVISFASPAGFRIEVQARRRPQAGIPSGN